MGRRVFACESSGSGDVMAMEERWREGYGQVMCILTGTAFSENRGPVDGRTTLAQLFLAF